jgi:carboxyl-terminal processing protease
MPQLPKIRAAIRDFADAPGIIFDVRGNPGGLGLLAAGIAGNLFAEQSSLGTMKFRAMEQKFVVYPQANAFKGRVVVLTDGGSASTSEVFAAGLQEQGRARVIGETTMGAVLLSVFDKIPTGAIFQYAISDYKSPKNILIEGRGVKPDREVKLTRADLLAGRDSQLEAAIQTILAK